MNQIGKPQHTLKPKPQITSTTNLGSTAFCELHPLRVTANLHQSNSLAGSQERIFLPTLAHSNCTILSLRYKALTEVGLLFGSTARSTVETKWEKNCF